MFGVLARDHGVAWAGWLVVGAVSVLALLFAVSARAARSTAAPALGADVADSVDDAAATRPDTEVSAPLDLACRQLVRLVNDYLDGVLPDTWRARVDEHVHDCDGCRAYLEQVRATIDLLEELDAERRRA